MDAVETTLMAVPAKGDAEVLKPLFDVMSIRRARSAADPAGHLLDSAEMLPLCVIQPVVHFVPGWPLELLRRDKLRQSQFRNHAQQFHAVQHWIADASWVAEGGGKLWVL